MFSDHYISGYQGFISMHHQEFFFVTTFINWVVWGKSGDLKKGFFTYILSVQEVATHYI